MPGPDSISEQTFGQEPHSSPKNSQLDAAFEAILKSEAFSKAYAIRSLLKYLWDHRDEAVDEYTIAIHGLHRRPDFDPKTDSAVRVNMARLRSKLKEFYDGEGRNSTLWLWIPRNGYELGYRFSDPQSNQLEASTESLPPNPPQSLAWRRSWLVAFAIILILALIGASWLVLRPAAVQAPPATGLKDQVPEFWRRFVSGANRTLMVLPDTVFLQWHDGRVSAGDSSVGAFSTWKSSPVLQTFAERLGQPTGWTHYLSAQDALATLRMSQYLGSFGIDVKVLASKDLMVDSFLDTNVILIGLPDTSFQLQSKTARLDFQVAPGGASIRNVKPKDGEPKVFETVSQTGRRQVSHGLVALLPGRTASTRTLVLSASNPLFILPLVTSKGPLNELDRVWRAAASPPYFQGVVETITDGDAVLRIRLVALRRVQVE